MIKLEESEHIIVAWPVTAYGPGWSNNLICILIQNHNKGSLRIEYIQGNEMTRDERILFPIVLSAVDNFTKVVENRKKR